MPKAQFDAFVKFYTSILSNPKVMMLPPELYRTWSLLLLVCKSHGLNGSDGTIPDDPSVAFSLHIGVEEWCSHRDQLVDRHFIDRVKGGANGVRYAVHDWVEYQNKTGGSAERMQRHRARHGASQKSSLAGARERVELSREEKNARDAREGQEDIFLDQNSHQEKAEPPQGNGRNFPDADNWRKPPVQPPPAKTRLEHSDYVWRQIVRLYSAHGLPERANGKDIWDSLDAEQQEATASGVLAWVERKISEAAKAQHKAETDGRAYEPPDPKYTFALEKLLTDGSFSRPLEDPEWHDRQGYWVHQANPLTRILKSWLAGPAK